MQLDLFALAPEAALQLTEELRQVVRLAQGGRCFWCDGAPARGSLDVVVLEDGRVVGLCRRDRLRWDARWRCAKAALALRGRRRARRPRQGQADLARAR